MKDKRQKHALPWSHPLINPLGTVLMGHVSPSSNLIYPFSIPQLSHLPFQHYSPLAPSTLMHGPYSAVMKQSDHLPLSQRLNNHGDVSPPAVVVYPSAGIAHHHVSCHCSFCPQWDLLKEQWERKGLRHANSSETKKQTGSLQWRDELV